MNMYIIHFRTLISIYSQETGIATTKNENIT